MEPKTEKKWKTMTELQRRMLAMYAANTFGAVFGAVFGLGSKINHSCVPNVPFCVRSGAGEKNISC